MPRLFMVTIPGLEVKSDWPAVHDRLLDEFPAVTDVLATTIPETVLIAYQGHAEVDAWLEEVDEALTSRRVRSPRSRTDSKLAHKPNTERNKA
jgi:hypothetical protein